MTVVVLHAGEAEATLDPLAGGRIADLRRNDVPLLRRLEDSPGTWAFWGSFPLLPWSNRIPHGTFMFEGEIFHVDVNWPDGSALHGLAATAPWQVDTLTASTAELSADLAGGPYVVRGRQTFELSPDRLVQTLTVENRGDRRLPFGLGIHPWFTGGPIRVPAASLWPSREALPTGPARPVERAEDLRARTIPPSMDQCYTDLESSDADAPGVRLSWNGPITQVVVYTAVECWGCVEPVTMANDGFRLLAEGVDGHGVVALDPGESLGAIYSFAFVD